MKIFIISYILSLMFYTFICVYANRPMFCDTASEPQWKRYGKWYYIKTYGWILLIGIPIIYSIVKS